jgi:hypothetical protein
MTAEVRSAGRGRWAVGLDDLPPGALDRCRVGRYVASRRGLSGCQLSFRLSGLGFRWPRVFHLRQEAAVCRPLIAGLAMMVVSYFAGSALVMSLICGAIVGAVYLLVRKGGLTVCVASGPPKAHWLKMVSSPGRQARECCQEPSDHCQIFQSLSEQQQRKERQQHGKDAHHEPIGPPGQQAAGRNRFRFIWPALRSICPSWPPVDQAAGRRPRSVRRETLECQFLCPTPSPPWRGGR